VLTFPWAGSDWQHLPEHHLLTTQQLEPLRPPQQSDAFSATATATAAVVARHELACQSQLLLQQGLPVGRPQTLIHLLDGADGKREEEKKRCDRADTQPCCNLLG
jgi:hypothetical protein